MSCCSTRSTDAEVLCPAGVNLFKNSCGASYSSAFLSVKDSLTYLFSTISQWSNNYGSSKRFKLFVGNAFAVFHVENFHLILFSLLSSSSSELIRQMSLMVGDGWVITAVVVHLG